MAAPTIDELKKSFAFTDDQAKAYILGYERGYSAGEFEGHRKGYTDAKDFMLKEMDRIFSEQASQHEEPVV